jgi:hypothetical protein
MRAIRPPTGPIDLTVVVVTLVDRAHLDRCLEQLTHTETTGNFEVIVPVDETFIHVDTLEMRYRGWTFLRNPGIRTYAQLRADGVKAAQGRLVAVTEDHCLPATNWVQSIIDAHEHGPVAIGGVVEKLPPDDPLNWAVYFLDYLRYMPPVTAGETHELTDLNVSYKMSALREFTGLWEREFHEPQVHAALAERGGKLWISPDILVNQRRDLEIGHALWDRYAFGRLFGSTRVAEAPLGKRITYALMSPLLPPLLVMRLLKHIIRKRRRGWQFLGALPLIVLLAGAWAYGECVGYITRTSDPRLTPKPEPELPF